jgi:CHAT domain-containing protein/tetratricopeptide (TPR) repeat protein
MITPLLWTLMSAAIAPQSPSVVDELLTLAAEGTDSALAAQVAEWPDEAREAVRQLFILAESKTETAEHLASAKRVAVALAGAWRDSFLLQQVVRFRDWSPGQRRTFVLADSIRREGNAAVYRDGVDAAMRRWRESLRLFTALGDSGGIAAALGNVGAGFYFRGVLDSARIYLERAARLAEQVGDLSVAGNAAVNLGSVAKLAGDLRRASEHYTRALSLHEQVGNHRGVAADHNNIGLIAQELGDIERARDAFESALALNRRHENLNRAADNLLNLGRLASTQGDYDAAVTRYREALATYRELSEPVNAALALHNLGILNIRRGDYPSALVNLRDALRIYEETGETNEAISTRRALATVQAAMGDLQMALRELRRAEEAAGVEVAGSEALLADLALARGDLAVRFNQLDEAQRAYSLASQLYRDVNDSRGQAEVRQAQGLLLLLREDFSGAQSALELALRAQQTLGDWRSAAWTRVLLASAYDELGDSTAARRSLEDAVAALHRLDDPVAEAAALGALAEFEVTSGMALAAESLYNRALRLVADRAAPTVSWHLRAGLGRALKSRGALGQAVPEFRAAIAEIERVSGALVLEERRAAFLADKWDVYGELVLLERARGRDTAAFEVSERMRARQMLDLLARGRIAGPRTAATELTAREQSLRRRIAELTAELQGSGSLAPLRGPDAPTRNPDVVREGLVTAQQRYTELLYEIRERSPQYASLVTGEAVAARDVMAHLASDQALLEFLIADSRSLVFVVTADTVAAVDLNANRKTIAALVDFVRGTMVRPVQGAPTRDLWKAPLRRLYQQLIGPVEEVGLLRGKRRLLIAPHAELHYLPFDALVASDNPHGFLIERYEVAYVPSASVWVGLRQRMNQHSVQRVLALAPRDQVLPASRDEVEAIERIFGNRTTVLVGSDATERELVRSAPAYDVIHLATYGILNKHNPLFSFVELNAGGVDDGRLEVHEVFGLGTNAHLVVLSACQTGLGSGALADVPAGDDWVGLVRAFLYAGASNVLATIWPVEDRATARLMERFYHHLESGSPPSEAVTLAKRASLSSRSTAHPFYWAGFVLVGGS